MARDFTKRSFLSSVRGTPPTAEGLRNWWTANGPRLRREGINFIDHPNDPAIVLSDGSQIDAIRNAGTASAQWQWLEKSPPTRTDPGHQARVSQDQRVSPERSTAPAYVDPMYENFDVPFEIDPYGNAPPRSLSREKKDWPPNTYWDDKAKVWKVLKPPKNDKQIARYKRLGINASSENPGEYDPTWGFDTVPNPWGPTEEDQWLKSVYEKQGWTLPPKDGTPTPTPVNGEAPSIGTPSEPYAEYKYFGTDPHQDWDVDLGYLRPAPSFEFEAEPWVAPEPFTYPAYEQPEAYQKPEDFSYAPFVAPSAAEVLAEDPGYQFRLGEGLRAMEAGAASRGTLRGGGTLKGLMDYGQSAASQEYEKAYNRRLQDYQTNLGREQQAYATNLGAGQWGYGANVDVGRDAYALQRQNALESAMLAQKNAYDAYVTNYANAYQQSRDRYQPEFQTWQQDQAARGQAARDLWGRQWEAYTYAQPSGTTFYQAGLPAATQ